MSRLKYSQYFLVLFDKLPSRFSNNLFYEFNVTDYFLENGYDFVLDADVSSGEVADGERLVFVEVQRKTNIYNNIDEMLEDINHLTGIKRGDWKFRWYKSNEYHSLNEENFKKIVPTTSSSYEKTITEYNNVKTETEKLNSDIEAIKKLSGIN